MANTSTGATDRAKETASTAAEQGKEVTRNAREAAGSVAQDARERVSDVTGEAKGQTRRVVDETRTQLRKQADSQTSRLAESLRTFSDELQALSSGQPDQAGTARRYVEQASNAVSDLASRLQDRSFEGLLQDVQRFARRRPGAFLAAAAATGFVAGRLARSASSGNGRTSEFGAQGQYGQYGQPGQYEPYGQPGEPGQYEPYEQSEPRHTPSDAATRQRSSGTNIGP